MTVKIDYAGPTPPITRITASCAAEPKDYLTIYSVVGRIEMKIVDSASFGSPSVASVQLTLEDARKLLSAIDKLISKMED